MRASSANRGWRVSCRWDEHTKTFVGGANLGEGLELVADDRFIDRNTYEWSTTISDSTAKALTRLQAREHRVSSPPPPSP